MTEYWRSPPGFAVFLSAINVSGVPFNIAVMIFNLIASAILSMSIYMISNSRLLSVACFAAVLLSPQQLLITRILRETIYPAQFLLFLGLLLIWMKAESRLRWIAAAGITFGWLWLSREDGIWLIPGTILCLVTAQHSARLRLIGAALFWVAAVLPIVALGAANFIYYGHWTTAEIKDPAFVAMISATQSIEDGGRIQGVAVTRSARLKIYEVSPTFRKLRGIIEEPGYFDFACTQTPSRCGEIGNGWWHWAVRYAAWQGGFHQNPTQARDFYRQVHADITAACATGRLKCGARPVASLPTMEWTELFDIPSYAVRLIKTSLLTEHLRVHPEASQGDPHAIALAFNFLNRPPVVRSIDDTAPYFTPVEIYENSSHVKIQNKVIYIYRCALLLLVIVSPAVIVHSTINRRPVGMLHLAILIFSTFVASRIALLSLVGVTSFNTANPVYLGPVYHLVALIFVFVVVGVAMKSSRATHSPFRAGAQTLSEPERDECCKRDG